MTKATKTPKFQLGRLLFLGLLSGPLCTQSNYLIKPRNRPFLSPAPPPVSGASSQGSGLQCFWHLGLVSWKTTFPQTEEGDGFGVIQAHYIYCALYFYYYYISSTWGHQALDPGGWGPLGLIPSLCFAMRSPRPQSKFSVNICKPSDWLLGPQFHSMGFPGSAGGKEPACQRMRHKRLRLGRSLGEGEGNPLQYSCLEDPMDREARRATVHRIAQSWTQLKWLNTVCSFKA